MIAGFDTASPYDWAKHLRQRLAHHAGQGFAGKFGDPDPPRSLRRRRDGRHIGGKYDKLQRKVVEAIKKSWLEIKDASGKPVYVATN